MEPHTDTSMFQQSIPSGQCFSSTEPLVRATAGDMVAESRLRCSRTWFPGVRRHRKPIVVETYQLKYICAQVGELLSRESLSTVIGVGHDWYVKIKTSFFVVTDCSCLVWDLGPDPGKSGVLDLIGTIQRLHTSLQFSCAPQTTFFGTGFCRRAFSGSSLWTWH